MFTNSNGEGRLLSNRNQKRKTRRPKARDVIGNLSSKSDNQRSFLIAVTGDQNGSIPRGGKSKWVKHRVKNVTSRLLLGIAQNIMPSMSKREHVDNFSLVVQHMRDNLTPLPSIKRK